MVKIRTLVPLTHPKTEEQFGAGTVVDVADDIAADWRLAGKITLISDEERNEQAATHYGDVVGRADVGQADPKAKAPGPQSDDEPKKGKK